jgi:multidrug efflux pump subunit AcrA (membrane-fusion protein)
MLTRGRPQGIAATACAAVALCSCVGKLKSTVPASATAATAAAELRQLRRLVRVTGMVQPVQAVSVPVPRLSESGELILTKIIPSGTQVEPGDLVAEFDRTKQLDKARDAQARYDDLSHQVEQRKAQHRSDSEKRASELQQAEADLAKARLDLRRGPLLSEIDRLKAESKLENAQAHVASLKKSMRLRDQAEAADEKILELQRDRQKVAMERAQSNAELLQLRAPLAGMVAQEIVWRNDGPGRPREGDQLWPGQPLVRIFSASEMEVQLAVAEPDGAVLIPGSHATVRLDAYPSLLFQARFDAASPVAASQFDSPVRTFAARYLLEGTDPHLLPDLSAAMDIELSTTKPVLSVPRAAVLNRRGRSYVTRVAGLGKREQHEVRLGAFDDSFVEIQEGLQAGDAVLLPAAAEMAKR